MQPPAASTYRNILLLEDTTALAIDIRVEYLFRCEDVERVRRARGQHVSGQRWKNVYKFGTRV